MCVCVRLWDAVLIGTESAVLTSALFLLRRSAELDLPYPDLMEYIADMNVMMALIINGPV